MDDVAGKIIEYINKVDSFGYLLIGINILLLIIAVLVIIYLAYWAMHISHGFLVRYYP